MKKYLLPLLLVLLVGCAMKPAESRDKSIVICTQYKDSYTNENLLGQENIDFEVDSTFNKYLNGEYIVFSESTYVISFNDLNTLLNANDAIDEESLAKLILQRVVHTPNDLDHSIKYAFHENTMIVVQRVVSPPEPTGWRSLIPDTNYQYAPNKNCRRESIDSLPVWNDATDPKLIGGDV